MPEFSEVLIPSRPSMGSPCPCGSGKRYKSCCFQKSLGELQSYREKFVNYEKCYAPEHLKKECGEKIIKAHTISKGQNLKYIAVDSKVYHGEHTIENLKNIGHPEITIEKIPLKKASIFKGFCGKHDKELFGALDQEHFAYTPEQLSLISYRSMCRELHHKEAFLNSIPDTLGENLADVEGIKEGSKLAIRDLKTMKKKLDDIIENKNYGDFKHHIFELQGCPAFVSSSVAAPICDFNGKELQQLGNEARDIHYIFHSCICLDENNGCFILSWLKEHEPVIKDFIESLTNQTSEQIANALVRFTFSYAENVFINPQWWENLDKDMKEKITYMANLDNAHDDGYLSSDSFDYNCFQVRKHYKLEG